MSDKKKKKVSKVEKAKEASDYLRSPIIEELDNDEPKFSRAAYEILKFHGSYQQDDRDKREGRNRHYMFMIRGRMPAGRLTADQYLAIDKVVDDYGDRTIRVTTRQAFQMYGVIKKELKKTLQDINAAMITTLGACGDVVRNVMATPAPDIDGRQTQVQELANLLSDELLPATNAYHEIWLDGEKIYSGKENGSSENRTNGDVEPLYKQHYLPRKFKIGLTLPGDNSIDLYTQDIGLVALFDEDKKIHGFNVVVGGGLGMNHKKADTYPRLGDHLGYVSRENVLEAVKGIIAVQRDLGDRKNRKQARMKYLIDRIGLEAFHKELADRIGYELEPFRDMPKFEPNLYLGWHQQADGDWFLGVSIENGRIKDEGDLQIKSGLRKIVREYKPEVRFTPNHNVILAGIREENKESIDSLLREHGILPGDKIPKLVRNSMACPAMPTCGLAITESERVFPDVVRGIHDLLVEFGLQEEEISVRMTGCPNGCARPYVADIGFVGRSLEKYTIFLGGNPAGTRIGEVYKDLVHFDDLISEIRPLIRHYKENRNQDEQFGDFWARIGIEKAQKLAEEAA